MIIKYTALYGKQIMNAFNWSWKEGYDSILCGKYFYLQKFKDKFHYALGKWHIDSKFDEMRQHLLLRI